MNVIDLIIFDCDGVLVDYELISKRNMAAYLTELGIPHTLEKCLELYAGLSMPTVIDLIETSSGPLPEEFAFEFRRRNAESSTAELEAIPFVHEAIKNLGYPKCVASSGHPDRIRQSLMITGLKDHFDENIFTALQVENGKPAPDLFLFAAEQMNAMPDRTVVIEDSVAGVQGAVAAGMRAIGFTGGSHITPGHDEKLCAAGADQVFDDMRELPHIISTISADNTIR